MSDPVLLALISGLPATIAAVGTLLNSLILGRHSKKLEQVSDHVNETKNQMDLLEINTNSIKDALVASTQLAAHSAGILEGVKNEQERMAKPNK